MCKSVIFALLVLAMLKAQVRALLAVCEKSLGTRMCFIAIFFYSLLFVEQTTEINKSLQIKIHACLLVAARGVMALIFR